MTKLKLINIYLEGFRACHYDKHSALSCPYAAGTEEAAYWIKGFEYAESVEKFLQGSLSLEHDLKKDLTC